LLPAIGLLELGLLPEPLTGEEPLCGDFKLNLLDGLPIVFLLLGEPIDCLNGDPAMVLLLALDGDSTFSILFGVVVYKTIGDAYLGFLLLISRV